MLDKVRRFFQSRVESDVGGGTPEAREHALRVAAAALIFEVVRADSTVAESELTVMRAAIQSTFGLGLEETEELIRLAEQRTQSAVSLYEFTRLIDQGFSADQKKRVVELLWLVTFADGKKDDHEEYLVRKIAGLLHVSHPDFIDAKVKARGQALKPSGG